MVNKTKSTVLANNEYKTNLFRETRISPGLSDKLFPVYQVAQKTATRSVGNLFCFAFLFFIN